MKKVLAATVAILACFLSAPAASAAPVTTADPAWGINDPSCVPTSEVKEPVILLHGTWDSSKNWRSLAPVLKEQGMCVWAFDYGADDVSIANAISTQKAIGDLDTSAKEIADHVRYVRQVTGAAKVNLVGHSQGGMHTKTYEQMYGDPGTVARVVAIAGNYHGTTLNGNASWLDHLVTAAPDVAKFLASTAGVQQLVGSPFITQLNSLPDTTAGVTYTSIYTPGDTTVTPNSSSQLTAVPGADVVNLDLGKLCGATPRHDQIPHNSAAIAQVVWGLTRGAGEQPTEAHCSLGVGGPLSS